MFSLDHLHLPSCRTTINVIEGMLMAVVCISLINDCFFMAVVVLQLTQLLMYCLMGVWVLLSAPAVSMLGFDTYSSHCVQTVMHVNTVKHDW